MILPTIWKVPEVLRNRLGHTTYGRQRAMVEEGHLLVVLHRPPGPDDREREGALFWRSPAGEWQASRGGPGPAGLTAHVQAYVDLENKLTHEYERAATITALFDLMEKLTPLVRAARNQHQALQAARDAIKADTLLIETRDLASEVERNLDLLIEDVRNGIQHRMAREAEAQSQAGREALQASHRLNVLAALFFPLTAITSLFGMNLAHGIDERNPAIFWLVFILGTALGFGMKSWVLAKPKSKENATKP